MEKTLRKFTSHDDLRMESYRYWAGKSMAEKVDAIAEMSEARIAIGTSEITSTQMLNDHRELLLAFNEHSVRYLLVGGYALGIYTEPRVTGDLDLFIEISQENAERVYVALAQYGTPLHGCSPLTSRMPILAFKSGHHQNRSNSSSL